MNTPGVLPTHPDPLLQTWGAILMMDPPVTEVSAAYAVLTTDRTVLADATAGAFTVSLPPASLCKGFVCTVKRMNAGANAVTLDPDGAETIEGAATVALSSQYASRTLQSTGTLWIILGST